MNELLLSKDYGSKRYMKKGNIIKCYKCGKELYKRLSQVRERNFCSKICSINGKRGKPRKGSIVKCAFCGKNIYKRQSLLKIVKRSFCSKKCANKGLIVGKTSICVICGKEYYRPPSQIKWRGSSCCSKKCLYLMLKNILSKNHGNKHLLAHRIRNRADWKNWREEVFKRDNYTCRYCGARSKKGQSVYLEPHHIKQFAYYPKLRFDIYNGITLCRECHKKHSNITKKRI